MSFPWMPLNIGDYIRDTMHLSTVEHGAYLLLIMHYWQHGGLPSVDRNLASIVKLTPEQWTEIKPTIAELFQPNWKHKRIEEELAIACATHAKRSASGKRAAYARYNKRMPDACAADANLPKEDSYSSSRLEGETQERPQGFFEAGELNDLTTSFPGVDHAARLKTFWPWALKQGKSPADIKAMYVAKMKREAGSTALVGDAKAPAQPSPELLASMKKKGWDDLKLPSALDRRRASAA